MFFVRQSFVIYIFADTTGGISTHHGFGTVRIENTHAEVGDFDEPIRTSPSEPIPVWGALNLMASSSGFRTGKAIVFTYM